MSRSRNALLLVVAFVLCITTNALSGDRFKDNRDGSITDTVTKLQWMKNTNPCGSVTWDEAFTCVAKLRSGWRVPTIQELYNLCNVKGTKL